MNIGDTVTLADGRRAVVVRRGWFRPWLIVMPVIDVAARYTLAATRFVRVSRADVVR